jgi:hypothetical protein
MYKAIPISKNNKVQTGPNTQLGGEKNGFVKEAYQSGILGIVKIEPIAPTISQAIIKMNILNNFFVSIKNP